jgi:hypothetical protein
MTLDDLNQYLLIIAMCLMFALGFIAGYRRY